VEGQLFEFDIAPDGKAAELLDVVLELAFELTQRAVHIDTHSLKSSGRWESDTDKIRHTWVGLITYGGPTVGPKNPVNYAIYERARGGSHDFFYPLGEVMPMFAEAVREGML
jgi:hypothetical protein